MLRDLTIKNYRCFKDFSIDGLARVNLIVGQNNSGKTSFLEAIYLLRSRGAFLRLLTLRGEYAETVTDTREVGREFPVSHLFNGHAQNLDAQNTITVSGQEEQIRMLVVPANGHENTELVASAEGGPFPLLLRGGKYDQAMRAIFPYDLRVESTSGGVSVYAVEENLILRTLRLPFSSSSTILQFVAAGSTDIQLLARLWDEIAQFPEREREVVAALQLLDPSVTDIRLASTHTAGTFLLGRVGQNSRVPLSSLGDGMRRVLALAISAITSENNVLLVDEIDTGLYHGALTNVWRLLIETAQRLNVQIFATTHSWDCVQSFQEALEATDQSLGLLFRLDRQFGDLRAVKYESGELAVAMREAIEVR